MKKIKLMADYQCHPLWGMEPDDFGDISPDDLPISLELKNNLHDWAARYDLTLNMDDPASSGFENEMMESVFIEDGRKLAIKLQEELGSSYNVVYQF
ncbi:hypothetical protein [Lelliottia amnigena]|uniref:hypothetical protein n=1 Tax=Lelliottia amnigena TaxID=61646 RepID=UPI000F9E1D13|nr:hypothetical protein [Lelliottia amnigena]MCG7781909.1 hypothetical protein [Lelliottia amnigena]